jgi:hypothetical protein
MSDNWRRLSKVRVIAYERIRLQLLQQLQDMDVYKYGEKPGLDPLLLAAREDVKLLKNKVAERMDVLIETEARESVAG